jgi:hypothetical protein
MRLIDLLIKFGLILIIGTVIQEKTMDTLYPNRPKGIIRNFIYNLENGR